MVTIVSIEILLNDEEINREKILAFGCVRYHYEIMTRLKKSNVRIIPVRNTIDLYPSNEIIRIPNFRTKIRRMDFYLTYIYAFMKILLTKRKFLKKSENIVIYDPSISPGSPILTLMLKLSKFRVVSALYHWGYPYSFKENLRQLKGTRKGWLIKAIDIMLFKFSLRFSDKIITLSEFSKQQLKALGVKNMNVIKTGIGIEVLPINFDESERRDCVFIGRISLDKGAFDLINIWKKVVISEPSARLKVAGIPVSINEWRKQIEENNLTKNIQYLGVLNHEKVYELLGKSLVFCFPSHIEGAGIAVAEAMHCKLPVVAWRIPAIQELFGEAEGVFLIDQGNYDDFANKVIELLKNKKKAFSLGEKNRNYILEKREFLWDEVAEKVHKVFENFERY
ncbi:MAG: glycosyltransferase family 4 protein [Thermoproteota archaeon]